MKNKFPVLVLMSLMLAACSTQPQRKVEIRSTPAPVESRDGSTPQTVTAPGGGGYLAGDGPGADIPPNLEQIPDAVPQAEPLHRYANRPYVALGKTYTPIAIAGRYKERGIASWYGKKFHGQRTSSGEVYDMYGMTAAHPILPIPSYARVTNLATGKSVVVRVNDRGPFLHDRIMDLSYTAAHKLGVIGNGSGRVEVESLAPGAVIQVAEKAETPQVRELPKVEPSESAPAPVPQVVAGGKVYLQLGAFKSREAAESFMAKMNAELGNVGQTFSLYARGGLTRVHLGPFADQQSARLSAEDLQGRLGFKPMVSVRD
ncbi:MAG: septal ring lytic transglycosylase RlpA family protein [Gallionella sp.]|nr:septal ring lytic transglycosylase RlpA family protein [Gallionella sp.]